MQRFARTLSGGVTAGYRPPSLRLGYPETILGICPLRAGGGAQKINEGPVSCNSSVGFVLGQALAGTPDMQTEQDLMTTFGLSAEGAALLRDRVFGGIVRAVSGNPGNRPNAIKDPIAYCSYERALREPSLIARIYPKYADQAEKLAKKRYRPAVYSRLPEESPKRWWQFWRRTTK